MLAFIGAAILVWLFMQLGDSTWMLFSVLFLISFSINMAADMFLHHERD